MLALLWIVKQSDKLRSVHGQGLFLEVTPASPENTQQDPENPQVEPENPQ